MNKAPGTNLGLNELKFCYSLNRTTNDVYSLGTRGDAPSLVFSLPDSHKGSNEDLIVVTGHIEPDPTNKPIPRRPSGPGLHFSSLTFAFLSGHYFPVLTLFFTLQAHSKYLIDHHSLLLNTSK